MPINDYRCSECENVWEDVKKNKCPACNSGNVGIVFSPGSQQFIVDHASTVEHVLQQNAKQMEGIYEEDASNDSQYSKDAEAATHWIGRR